MISLDELNYAVNQTYKIATRAALNGKPLQGIQYVPSRSATQLHGMMIVNPHRPMGGSETAPWDK